MSTTQTNFRRITKGRIRTVEVPRGRKTPVAPGKVTLIVKNPHKVVKTPEVAKDVIPTTETKEKEETKEETLKEKVVAQTTTTPPEVKTPETKPNALQAKRTRRKRPFNENSTET